jgi:hypothetical protein
VLPLLLREVCLGNMHPEAATKKCVEIVRECLQNKQDRLKEELSAFQKQRQTKKLQKRIEHYEEKINYYKIQIEGTQEPSYAKLSGIYNPQTKTHTPRSDEELVILSFSQLTPMES